jgi:hypothetical protein
MPPVPRGATSPQQGGLVATGHGPARHGPVRHGPQHGADFATACSWREVANVRPSRHGTAASHPGMGVNAVI